VKKVKKATIIEEWLKGHSQEWLQEKHIIDIANTDRCKDMKKNEIKLLAKKDVEEALIDWWRCKNEQS